MSESKNIYQRMLAVMTDLESISKSDKLVNGQYGFVAHDAVTKALHPLCVTHGIHIGSHVEEFSQVGDRTEVTLAVRFTNVNQPEDAIMVKSLGYGIDKHDKGPGKAISYALKTCLLKQFLLEAGEYDNENGDTNHDVGQASNRGGGRTDSGGTSSTPLRLLSDPIWFGKHKDEAWADAPKSYLDWLAQNPQGDGEGSRIAQEELDRRAGVIDGGIEDVKRVLDGMQVPVVDEDDSLPF